MLETVEVSQVAWDILAASAPKGARMRNVVRIGQRWQHRRTGLVVAVYQVHRADRQVEVYPAGAEPTPRQLVPFAELKRRYRLLGREEL